MKLLSLRELQMLQLDLMKKVDNFCSEHGIEYYLIGGSCLGAVRHKGFIPWDDDIDIAMLREHYDKFVELFQKEFSEQEYFLQNYDTDKEFSPALSRICIRGTLVDIASERHLRTCKNAYIDIFPLDHIPDTVEEREKHRKKLYVIDRLIGLKQYHLYRFTKLEIIAKKIVSLLLSIIPLKCLQRLRVATMTKYKDVLTENVCSTVSKYGYRKQIMSRSIYGKPARMIFEDACLNVPEDTDMYLTLLFGSDYMELPPESKRVAPQTSYRDENATFECLL